MISVFVLGLLMFAFYLCLAAVVAYTNSVARSRRPAMRKVRTRSPK